MAISKGYTFSDNEQVTAAKLHLLADSATIDAGAVDTDELADGAVTNAKLASAAGIALSKIAVTNGKLVGSSSGNTAEEVTVGSTLTYASSALGIADSGVGTTQLAASAVTVAKLAATLDLSSNTVTLPDGNIGAAKLDQDFIADVTETAPATGDYVVFGDITDSNNIKKATVQSIVDAAQAFAAVTSASAALTAVTAASGQYLLNAAHGLGRLPYFTRAVLVCTDAGGDIGYSQNDEVDVNSVFDTTDARPPFAIGADDTYLFATERSTEAYRMPIKGNSHGGDTVITDSKWALKVYAW